MPALPPNLDAVPEEALQKVRLIPGYLQESEARFLGLLAACAPAHGTIVEIGSFKGRSTVILEPRIIRTFSGAQDYAAKYDQRLSLRWPCRRMSLWVPFCFPERMQYAKHDSLARASYSLTISILGTGAPRMDRGMAAK
jgi:hypothetical protein